MINRLISAAFFVVLLFAGQALAQEPVKVNRAELICFGQCDEGFPFRSGPIFGLEVGTGVRQLPLPPALPDVQLPRPSFGPQTWNPWVVCLSLGISPDGSLVCRQWGYDVQDPWTRSPYRFNPIRIHDPRHPAYDFTDGGCSGVE